ncbi:50S rRNA methyltransferase [Bacillaceae bacterium JMAK1]|nr:50S rRNA methyltransferase [Bacillaceae bacterium JMAK1]
METTIQINEEAVKSIRKGNFLIYKTYFRPENYHLNEGELLTFQDEQGRFVGRGYYGKQNIGHGWILTQDERTQINDVFFTKALQKAFNDREAIREDEQTTAFRLFNGEGDGIGGLTIDVYAGHCVVTFYSKGMYTFKSEIINALQKVVAPVGIYEKKRFATDGKYEGEDDFVTGERGEFPMLVQENGMHFAVNLNDGPMTGIFLDQRDVRKKIRDEYAYEKEVLNLFSYTGAFSVAAALGGAKQTTSVDLANRSRAKTEEQFLVNGLPVENERIIVMDVFKYFSYALKKDLSYDLVVIDPPSFARSKKKTFSVANDYKGLLQEAIGITRSGGTIVASTNAANVPMNKFKRFVEQAFKAENSTYTIEEEFGLPDDFKATNAYAEGSYLKVLFIRKH